MTEHDATRRQPADEARRKHSAADLVWADPHEPAYRRRIVVRLVVWWVFSAALWLAGDLLDRETNAHDLLSSGTFTWLVDLALLLVVLFFFSTVVWLWLLVLLVRDIWQGSSSRSSSDTHQEDS